MNLAWKVMLPLGLLNLVTVATVEEFRPQLVAALGTGLAGAVAIALPWIACLVGWVVAGVFTPSGTDNTPILTHDPLDIERDMADRERREQATHDASQTEMAGSR
jgi:hypothetical protein